MVDITPTLRIRRGARIVIQMTDDDYTFSGDYCTSQPLGVVPLYPDESVQYVAPTVVTTTVITASTTINYLLKSQYICTVNHPDNSITVQILNLTLQEGVTLRF